MGELNLRGSMLPGSRRRRPSSPTATDIFRFVSMMADIGFAPPPHIMTPRRRLTNLQPDTPGPSRPRPAPTTPNPRPRNTPTLSGLPPTFSIDRLLRMLRTLRGTGNAGNAGTQPNVNLPPSRSTTAGRAPERGAGPARPSGTAPTRQATRPTCTVTSSNQRPSTSIPRPRVLTNLPIMRNASTNTTDDLENNQTIKVARTQAPQSNYTVKIARPQTQQSNHNVRITRSRTQQINHAKNARTQRKSEDAARPSGSNAQPATQPSDDASVINVVVLENYPEDEASSSTATPVAHPTTQINVTPIESQEMNFAQNTPVTETSSGAVVVSDIIDATTTFNVVDAVNFRNTIPENLEHETRALTLLMDWDNMGTATLHQLEF